MKVFIVILNYNRPQDTSNCIRSLKQSTLPTQTKIIVVDNWQKPNSALKILVDKYIHNRKNLGFAAGNNVGIKYALKNQVTHIMIINPDTTVPKNFLKPLLTRFNQIKDLGLIAPAHRHRQKNKTVYGLGGTLDWQTGKAKHQNVSRIKSKKIKPYQFVSFACVLIKKQVFDAVDLLDERFFMYLEDVDYCLSATRAGFKVYLDPAVVINHQASSSFKDPRQKLKLSFISQFKLINKWLPLTRRIKPLIYTLFFYPYLYLLWTWHRLKYQN